MNPICIVDDQPQICSTISGILTDEGYNSNVFADAESFWQSLDTLEPSLVLLDIWLPGVDGLELLKRLNSRFPKLPVIMMSGHAGIETAVTAIKAGAFDFMEKPLHLEVLLDKVEAAINQGSSKNGKALPVEIEIGPTSPEPSTPTGMVDIVVSSEPQRTLGEVIVLNGVGLLSGRKTGIILSPLGVNEGIIFQTLDGKTIPGNITYLETCLVKDQIDRSNPGIGAGVALPESVDADCLGPVVVIVGATIFIEDFGAAGEEQESRER